MAIGKERKGKERIAGLSNILKISMELDTGGGGGGAVVVVVNLVGIGLRWVGWTCWLDVVEFPSRSFPASTASTRRAHAKPVLT